MIDTLFLLQYSFLNGWLLKKCSESNEQQSDKTWVQVLLNSVLISLSTNSVILYIFIKLFKMEMTKFNITLMSLGISGILVIGYFSKRLIISSR